MQNPYAPSSGPCGHRLKTIPSRVHLIASKLVAIVGLVAFVYALFGTAMVATEFVDPSLFDVSLALPTYAFVFGLYLLSAFVLAASQQLKRANGRIATLQIVLGGFVLYASLGFGRWL
ncbi:hypothetical protein [Allorhodopirellula heiligendammensis]|nr:hypothetical protein [Allorhodopirellula heiligendammensis]